MMRRRIVHMVFYLLALGLIAVPIARERARRLTNPWIVLSSPYPPPPWTNRIACKANLHTHTTQSDGQLLPHEVIDRYRALGYSVLSLTDHNEVTWPWTNLASLPAKGHTRRLIPARQQNDGSPRMENRDPAESEMIAIQGCEWSQHHHMGAFFTALSGGETERESLLAARADNPEFLAMFYHPGRYTHPPEWYVRYFESFRELVGVEIFNQGDRYPGDRKIWDAILSRTMPQRPVWGYSNDDMHEAGHLGRNWNVLILTNRSVAAIREALIQGHSWFVYAPEGHTGPPPPAIREIHVQESTGAITLRADHCLEISWISEGRIIATGALFRATEHPDAHRYIRAMLQGPGGVAGTQPFALYRPLSLAVQFLDHYSEVDFIPESRTIHGRLLITNKSDRMVQPFIQARWQEKPFFGTPSQTIPPRGVVAIPFSIPAKAFLESRTLRIEALLDKTFEPHHLVVFERPLSVQDLQ